MKRAAGIANAPPPPGQLADLVERIGTIETSDHWPCYENVHGPSQHAQEATIPIVDLQHLLDRGCESCIGWGFDMESYEMDLYSISESLSLAIENANSGE